MAVESKSVNPTIDGRPVTGRLTDPARGPQAKTPELRVCACNVSGT